MLIQRTLKKLGHGALAGPSIARRRVAFAFILLAVGCLAGCGGGSSSSSNKNAVSQVLVSPSTASLVAGQVLNLTFSAVNSSNNPVPTTFTFNSSNTAVATVSPRGEVCGGVWDSLFVVCNGLNASNNPVSGAAVITVTAAGGVTSGPITLAVHPTVTAVTVDPLPAGSCLSTGETHQFTPHAFHNGVDITPFVGNFNWSAADATVASVDANGLATARIPGLSGVVAGIGSTTSPATPFKTCMPVQI
ncbi:MAG TPA: hypothetical protein VE133_12785, partial [Candidatus Sulfotelmatobacter sp.]|nr:hypothetical protein [Candidatus Sulfotelmatobacter sp.]